MPHPDENIARGIYLALTPDYGFDRSLVGLDIHLVNGLDTDIGYYFEMDLANTDNGAYEGEVPAGDFIHLDHLYFGQLNENPALTVECSFDEGGKLCKTEKTVRIKPKVIHNGPKYSSLINEEAFVYEVYLQKELPPDAGKLPTPKRKLEFDAEMLKHFMTDKTPAKSSYNISTADHELDLHFHALVKDEAGWNGAEKLNLQLETFRKKLDNAIANGLHSMVVIHGVGSGRLKEEVGKILKQHPKVKSFGPSFQRKYGFGATEVFF